jgi:diadenosine tetraphosphate (Ap4A) HIT family hydrolase
LTECAFCDAGRKFSHTWFSDVKEQQCVAWIDYAMDSDHKFLWYAVLNGDQYTIGHTLFILGPHRHKITDCSLKESELNGLAVGLKKVTARLKDLLKVETVHVLSLCEGIKHLHFHLIPRYHYEEEEKQFYIENYWDREKDILGENGEKKWKSKKDFENAVMNNSFEIHGMWYAAYHEMKFKNSDFWKLTTKERIRVLEDRAKHLRDPNLQDPFK